MAASRWFALLPLVAFRVESKPEARCDPTQTTFQMKNFTKSNWHLLLLSRRSEVDRHQEVFHGGAHDVRGCQCCVVTMTLAVNPAGLGRCETRPSRKT